MDELTLERHKVALDVELLSIVFYGSHEALNRRKYIANLVESISEFNDPVDLIHLEREQRYENAMRKSVAMVEYAAQHIDVTNISETHYFQKLVLNGDASPLYLHYVMFIPTLMSQCDVSQAEKWLPLAYSHQIIGTYAQTELGHGTNLKSLETTAIYDIKTREFVISTPSLAATKWWPGNLGKTANYVIVIAQLIIGEKKHGIQAFLVPIRSLLDHTPLPGVTVGDIGPKFGMTSNDNGFLRLDNVRVPLDHMLMRHAKVSPDGTYLPPRTPKSVYSSMIYVRSIMVCDQSAALATAATIAARYSCIRRQGGNKDGGPEKQIIDYQSQQHRVVPNIVKAYAFHLAGRKLYTLYTDISAKVVDGDARQLPQLHALSAGLKALVTFETAKGIEQCRLACGGHGYLMASGFPQLYADTVAGCTYEGDNIVLLLQVARSLVKLFNNSADIACDEFTSYLTAESIPVTTLDFFDNETLVALHEASSRRLIKDVCSRIVRLQKNGLSFDYAWSKCLVLLTKCATAHVQTFVLRNFLTSAESCDENIRSIVSQLVNFYALHSMFSRKDSFFRELDESQFSALTEVYFDRLADLRPIVVPLVDGFAFTDRELRSCLGKYDGKPYECLYECALKAPFNASKVLKCHSTYLTSGVLKSKL